MNEMKLLKASILIVLIVSIVIVSFECSVVLGRDYSIWLESCKPYKAQVVDTLRQNGLSEKYYYLMVAESRCRDNAISKRGAAGFWQLMPDTSKKFGCNNPHDLACSTSAAIKYIQSLERRFNRFEDVVIAYNMGGHNYMRFGATSQALGLVYTIRRLYDADKK